MEDKMGYTIHLIVSHLKFKRSPFKEGQVHSVLNNKVVKFPLETVTGSV